jgi:nucleotide-binding universal stress UspA family protein
MAKKILFPTDFSTSSEVALEQATALARDLGAEMLIVHVAETPVTYRSADIYYGIYEPDDSAVRKMLHAVVPTDPVVYYEHRLLHGEPAERIVETAEAEHCDLIIMATHGRTGFRRLLMGSVAEEVVRSAQCAVLTYKMPQQTQKAATVRELAAAH